MYGWEREVRVGRRRELIKVEIRVGLEWGAAGGTGGGEVGDVRSSFFSVDISSTLGGIGEGAGDMISSSFFSVEISSALGGIISLPVIPGDKDSSVLSIPISSTSSLTEMWFTAGGGDANKAGSKVGSTGGKTGSDIYTIKGGGIWLPW